MSKIEELKKAGAIYFDKIQEGFDLYHHEVVKLNKEEAYKTIKKLWELNGSENSYADFYYFKIDEKAREKVHAMLEEEEVTYLEDLPVTDEIIFSLEEKLLKILIKLNDSETLFSTFYFTKEPCTLWGNYNSEYVIFTHSTRETLHTL